MKIDRDMIFNNPTSYQILNNDEITKISRRQFFKAIFLFPLKQTYDSFIKIAKIFTLNYFWGKLKNERTYSLERRIKNLQNDCKDILQSPLNSLIAQVTIIWGLFRSNKASIYLDLNLRLWAQKL